MARFVVGLCRPFLALVLVAAATGCGTGFVDGWREDEPDTRTDEEKCDAREGYTWTGDSCVAVADVPLVDMTEVQCMERQDAAWLDGTCQEIEGLSAEQCGRVTTADVTWQAGAGLCMTTVRAECMARGPDFDLVGDQCLEAPTLTTEGPLTQTVAAGQAMAPIKLTVAAGADVTVSSAACPEYFAITSNALVSKAGAAAPAGVAVCKAELSASRNGRRSQAVVVTVRFTAGLLKLCQEPPNQEVTRTVSFLKEAAKKESCEDIAAVLAEAVSLDLKGADIVDLSPLVGLPKLRTLILTYSYRLIDVAPLASLASLVDLDISHTRVKDVSSLADHAKLTFLVADLTPLDVSGAGGVSKTQANCPTGAAVNRAVRNFCLNPPRSEPLPLATDD